MFSFCALEIDGVGDHPLDQVDFSLESIGGREVILKDSSSWLDVVGIVFKPSLSWLDWT